MEEPKYRNDEENSRLPRTREYGTKTFSVALQFTGKASTCHTRTKKNKRR
jgi:hypothetical protein